MKRLTSDEFIRRAQEIHGDKYDYSQIAYINNHTKIVIICPIHGGFQQTPDGHLAGKGCKLCGIQKIKEKSTMPLDVFIKRGEKIHGDRYTYMPTEYKNENSYLTIKCNKCGNIFKQKASYHLSGNGCSKCNKSHLETCVELLLKENNIKFVAQCKKDTFSWLNEQSLDFYLPDYNIAIECQGGQHFYPVDFFGGIQEFEKNLERDRRKRNLCKEHNIELLYYTNLHNKATYYVITDLHELLKKILKSR